MRTNRAYKRGKSFRDARLFVVACEGAKREKEYFERLGQGSRRLKVQVLSPDNTKEVEKNAANASSAPKWVMDRLVKYIEKEGVNVETGDIVWIIMDVDRWPKEQLYELCETCRQSRWGIALSNPCFEVWLYMHVEDIHQAQSKTCREFKQELGQIVKGGYRLEKFIQLISIAIQHGETVEDDLDSPIPGFKVSRVYQPVKEILEMF